MVDAAWHDEIRPFMTALEYIGTFAGAMSGVRLACYKRFDWFGAYVIGFVTALGGGTLRDIMLGVTPFWMTAPSYLFTTFLAVVAVWLFGRRFISGKITWFIFDTIAISVFMVIGLEKSIRIGVDRGIDSFADWWCAIIMGVITAVFGGVMRDICINEVPLIFRKEIYALACVIGGLAYYICHQLGLDSTLSAIICGLTVVLMRLLAVKYKLHLPIIKGED